MNLNIITLNIPYPPDYGGMIDTFYRIKELCEIGVHVHLHCFMYGRLPSKELEKLCETVSYYPRKTGFFSHLSIIPFIVCSRRSKNLLENLGRNDYPILFDGLHTTIYIKHPSLSNRKKLVRAHNIEHKYYKILANRESNLLRKIYFLIESVKLKRYENVLQKTDFILPISDREQEYFQNKYRNSVYLGPYHPFNKVESLAGMGKYILYHGDLSVNANALIVDSLISNVFSKINYPCIIAGKNPPEFILNHASAFSNIQVISSPDNIRMKTLIRNAHINILPASATNGFKIKLLIALYSGRHCIVNSTGAENNLLKSLCNIADTDEEILKIVHLLMQEQFNMENIQKRQSVLSENYNNLINTKKLVEIIRIIIISKADILLIIGLPVYHKLQSSQVWNRHHFLRLSSNQ